LKPIHQWTLAEKIGQMFIITVEGEEMTPALEEMITNYHIGGVILFQKNLRSLPKVVQLIERIQEVAKQHNKPPLWVSVDQEGGGISYLWDKMVISPGNMLLGATNNPLFAYEAATIMGLQLKEIGFNMIFNPVLDINNNPYNPVIGTRSFGEEKELVASFGIETVKGFTDAGILSVGKHYPGHGDTHLDSHLSLPKVEKTLQELEQFELYPFFQCMEHGMQGVMTAHIVYPKIDPDLPATLSPYFLKQQLRENYQFNGLILTDSMEMEAISTYFGRENGTVRAIKAGTDIILACGRNYPAQQKMIEAAIDAVTQGEIDKDDINQNVNRIMEHKKRWINLEPKTTETIEEYCNQDAFHQKMIDISVQGISLILDRDRLVPFAADQEDILIIGQATYNDENYMGERKNISKDIFNEPRYIHYHLQQPNPANDDVTHIYNVVENDQVIVVCINERRELNSSWVNLMNELIKKTKNIIVISLWNPQIIRYLPGEIGTYIAAYSNTFHVISALKQLLEGNFNFNGTPPVTLVKGD
jgi:beta-N-acetylhexosaminidase